MDFLGLTNLKQVRAVLTVSEADLPDTVLEDQGLEDDLAEELHSWIPEWEALTEEAPKRKLRLFAKYYLAGTVAGMATVFVLKKMTDGSNEGQRSDKDGYSHLASILLHRASGIKAELLEELDQVPEMSIPTITSRVTPARDVITEGRGIVSE